MTFPSDPRPLDTEMGHPILSRHADDVAVKRERELGVLPTFRCAHCAAGISFLRFTFCVACLEQLPDELRRVLYGAYRYGQVDQPKADTPSRQRPRDEWLAAYHTARRILAGAA